MKGGGREMEDATMKRALEHNRLTPCSPHTTMLWLVNLTKVSNLPPNGTEVAQDKCLLRVYEKQQLLGSVSHVASASYTSA